MLQRKNKRLAFFKIQMFQVSNSYAASALQLAICKKPAADFAVQSFQFDQAAISFINFKA